MGSERMQGIGETVLGAGLMGTPLWSPMLEQIVAGAHAVAAIGGALVALHGVWRILKGWRT